MSFGNTVLTTYSNVAYITDGLVFKRCWRSPGRDHTSILEPKMSFVLSCEIGGLGSLVTKWLISCWLTAVVGKLIALCWNCFYFD